MTALRKLHAYKRAHSRRVLWTVAVLAVAAVAADVCRLLELQDLRLWICVGALVYVHAHLAFVLFIWKTQPTPK